MAATLHWSAIAPLSLINSNDLAPAAYDFETRNNARNVTAKVGRAVPVPKQGGLGKTLAPVPLSTRISRVNSDRRLPADAEDRPETRDPRKDVAVMVRRQPYMKRLEPRLLEDCESIRTILFAVAARPGAR